MYSFLACQSVGAAGLAAGTQAGIFGAATSIGGLAAGLFGKKKKNDDKNDDNSSIMILLLKLAMKKWTKKLKKKTIFQKIVVKVSSIDFDKSCLGNT